MTKDIQYADVFFTVLGGKADLDATLEGLEHSAKFIRSELAKRVHLRRVPELRFRYDASLENANRIEALLQTLKGKN